MSIKLLSAAWDLAIPSTEKMVLMCLCDHANDTGVCWPSVATIVRKTSKSERTVQSALKWLKENGFYQINGYHKQTPLYELDPRKICTPAKSAPPQKLRRPPQISRQTPAKSAPKPLMNHQEPSSNNRRAKACQKPDGVSDDLWGDWLSHRDGKFSQTALAGFEREAAKAGWTVAEAFTEAIERKWQGFKADWVKDKQNGNSGRISNNSTGNGFRAALRQVSAGGADEPWGDNLS